MYIPEEGLSIDTLQRDIKHLCKRYAAEDRRGIPNEGRVILRSEMVSTNTYTTEVVSRIFREEGKGLFDSRTAVLGHLQQGGVPSPLDRVRATRLAVNCINWLQQSANEARAAPRPAAMLKLDSTVANPSHVYTTRADHSVVIGIRGASVVFTPVADIYQDADVKARRGREEWWMDLKDLIMVLAKYEYVEDEGVRVEMLKNREPTGYWEHREFDGVHHEEPDEDEEM